MLLEGLENFTEVLESLFPDSFIFSESEDVVYNSTEGGVAYGGSVAEPLVDLSFLESGASEEVALTNSGKVGCNSNTLKKDLAVNGLKHGVLAVSFLGLEVSIFLHFFSRYHDFAVDSSNSSSDLNWEEEEVHVGPSVEFHCH